MSIVNSRLHANRTASRACSATARALAADSQHVTELLERVADRVAPVWPLEDYVAVNPYQGLSAMDFLAARRGLRQVSDAELLMPFSYYAERFQAGGFDKGDINAAIDELLANGVPDVETINVNLLLSKLREQPQQPVVQAGNTSRQFSAIDMVDRRLGSSWSRWVMDEIGKHCAMHYDRGQAIWSQSKSESLYSSWRDVARHDRSLDVLGVHGLRQLVGELPARPALAVAELCVRLGIPAEGWEQQLWCEALAVPGWSAWTRYQARMAEQRGQFSDDFVALLAMRLTYACAIAEHLQLAFDWTQLESPDSEAEGICRKPQHADDDALFRYVLLTASEIAFRRNLLGSLKLHDAPVSAPPRPSAQMVFCIDVRSERFRRQLEAESRQVETYGFAGFFGMPIEFVPFGEQLGSAQVPVLIQPKFQVREGLLEDGLAYQSNVRDCRHGACRGAADCDAAGESTAHRRATEEHVLSKNWNRLWRSFSTSAVSTFAFVETTGLLYGLKMLQQFFASVLPQAPQAAPRSAFAPSLQGLLAQQIDLQQQVAMAEGALRGIGLASNQARLIVLCGHGSQTENNPLQAGLDCGACGGHTGEANARFAAMLLNQPLVRQGLSERGIELPADVHFLAALHNTTTDSITFYDEDGLPESHRADLEQLRRQCVAAGERTRHERLETLPGNGTVDLVRRSRDWSEVRPEWGLAGNATFIAAPRELTRATVLHGRSFLHSYDHHQDSGYAVLEQIMTAPLVVAHWINMQYYASTVDADRLGSGNKTVHNVVGQFGILSGNAGDLMTGLPWQSIHDGVNYQHQPLRLLGVLAAPRSAIQEIIQRHIMLDHLLTNDWLHLLAIEDSRAYRFTRSRQWEELTASWKSR